jgi:hypothetical protein
MSTPWRVARWPSKESTVKRSIFLLALTVLCFLPAPAVAGDTLFYSVDIYIDSGERPLAAWQLEVHYNDADITIVGVEGGDRPFREAPYYDHPGMRSGRIILAAFSTDRNAPAGRLRVARIHLMEEGDGDGQVEYSLILAAGPDGEPYEAEINAERTRGGNHE